MSSDIIADLIIGFVIIIVGVGMILHGRKLQSSPPAETNFASPQVFFVLGVILIVTQVLELVQIYFVSA